jgi:FAD/FMN-containing dehydrogenase
VPPSPATFLVPDDETYDEARALWNGRIDRHPAAVVRVTSTDDVAAALQFARDHDRGIPVRGGGHHVTGSAVLDDAIVVDLSELTDVTVDAGAQTVRLGGGCRVSDVLSETRKHGLAITCGSAAHNGVAGSTLAGAIGWVRPDHGLGVDELRSVEVVTIDGEVLTASAGENSDLFWGVRGGGANFGVATSFEFNCSELGPGVTVARPIYPAPDDETVRDLFGQYRAYAADAPREVTSMAIVTSVPSLPFVPQDPRRADVHDLRGVFRRPCRGRGRHAPAPRVRRPCHGHEHPDAVPGAPRNRRRTVPRRRPVLVALAVRRLADRTARRRVGVAACHGQVPRYVRRAILLAPTASRPVGSATLGLCSGPYSLEVLAQQIPGSRSPTTGTPRHNWRARA